MKKIEWGQRKRGGGRLFNLEPYSMIMLMIISTHTKKNGNANVEPNFDGFRLNEVAHIKIKYLFNYYCTFHKSINFFNPWGSSPNIIFLLYPQCGVAI
jgi:hypothetical protein